MVLADSLVKFEGLAVELEHGAVRVTTSRGLTARAGDVTVKFSLPVIFMRVSSCPKFSPRRSGVNR
jgi:hypothetical protein